MAQQLISLDVLSEDLSLIPSTHTIGHDSSLRGSYRVDCPLLDSVGNASMWLQTSPLIIIYSLSMLKHAWKARLWQFLYWAVLYAYITLLPKVSQFSFMLSIWHFLDFTLYLILCILPSNAIFQHLLSFILIIWEKYLKHYCHIL